MQDGLWNTFAQQEDLDTHQLDQFKVYADLLIDWNKRVNLTRITDLDNVIAYHFQDSLHIRDYIDLIESTGIVDVGTGAGFPGIPLAIVFPELPLVLVEVNQKKIAFLQEVIKKLALTQVSLAPMDFRTFLRTTDYPADYIFARASLPPEELVRAFRASCPYQKATIVYWASQHWQSSSALERFFKKEEKYVIKGKKRRFIFLSKP